MTTPLTPDERQQLRELAGAIRAGCEMHPQQTSGGFARGEVGACALDAAYVGAGLGTLDSPTATHDAYDGARMRRRKLEARFPRLTQPWPPAAMPLWIHPSAFSLWDVIVELNDDIRRTREKIADWLEARAASA